MCVNFVMPLFDSMIAHDRHSVMIQPSMLAGLALRASVPVRTPLLRCAHYCVWSIAVCYSKGQMVLCAPVMQLAYQHLNKPLPCELQMVLCTVGSHSGCWLVYKNTLNKACTRLEQKALMLWVLKPSTCASRHVSC